MKIVRYAVLSLLALPSTYFLTSRYLSSWWSERVLSWLGHLWQDFGLASDIEFLFALACSFSLSFATLSFLFWILQVAYGTQAQKGLNWMKEVINASLMGFWVLFATYYLLRLGDRSGVQAVEVKTGSAPWANLSVSLIIVSAVTLLGFFLWRRISKHANKSFQRTR